MVALAAAVSTVGVAQAQDIDRNEAQEARAEQRQERQAQAESRQQARAEWRQQRGARPAAQPDDAGEVRAARQQARAEWRQQREAREQARTQDGASGNRWNDRSPGDVARYGRNWNDGGVVNRPDAAAGGATPAIPDRQASGRWGERNRTYSDPARSRTYDRDRRDRDRSVTYRDGYRDGRTADSWRDRRDQTQAYRDGYRSGSDWSRDGYSGTRYSRDYRSWDRNDWRRDSRYDWYRYRTYNRDLFRAGRYYSPYRNYSYSRLGIGFSLGSGFYSNRYWINDPWQYRLPSVYGPYRWVRYYDDVLLVDIYSGRVVDVIHDFFW
jgi:hypothetical protein